MEDQQSNGQRYLKVLSIMQTHSNICSFLYLALPKEIAFRSPRIPIQTHHHHMERFDLGIPLTRTMLY